MDWGLVAIGGGEHAPAVSVERMPPVELRWPTRRVRSSSSIHDVNGHIGVRWTFTWPRAPVLVWHLLTHETDYRWAPADLTEGKIRRVELAAAFAGPAEWCSM